MTNSLNTNSNSIKFSGRAEINAPLELDKNYEVIAKGSITKSEDHSNQDGTKDTVFTFKLIHAEIKDELGKTIKVKDPRSWSAKMRAVINQEWEEKPEESKTSQEYYDSRMQELISRLVKGEI